MFTAEKQGRLIQYATSRHVSEAKKWQAEVWYP